MELYSRTSFQISKLLTSRYSTSFGMSTRLFPVAMRQHIYAIYGMVRIGDEIVDTYRGSDAAKVLRDFEKEVYAALARGYSTNPVVHAFAMTATSYGITKDLIQPFFESMAMDLHPVEYDRQAYDTYIYGSAEVVGLMCLRIFCEGDDELYQRLEKGARALGAAYQKVNFLRDIAADYKELGRLYFPGTRYESFNESAKARIIKEIKKDFTEADKAIVLLPQSAKKAVSLSVAYYGRLLKKIERTPAETLKVKRIRISNAQKTRLLATHTLRRTKVA